MKRSEVKILKEMYELSSSFVREMLPLCQKKNNYCGNPYKSCVGCNIYEMAMGNDDKIRNWILDVKLKNSKAEKCEFCSSPCGND